MALDRLDMVSPGVPPVSVHDKSNVSGYGSLTESTDEQFAEAIESPFCWRRLEEPLSELGEVRHGDLCC